MWVTVIVTESGTVTVRPDKPSESDASYQRARAGAVFEHRTQLATVAPGDVIGAIQSTIDVLIRALESAPLPDRRDSPLSARHAAENAELSARHAAENAAFDAEP